MSTARELEDEDEEEASPVGAMVVTIRLSFKAVVPLGHDGS